VRSLLLSLPLVITISVVADARAQGTAEAVISAPAEVVVVDRDGRTVGTVVNATGKAAVIAVRLGFGGGAIDDTVLLHYSWPQPNSVGGFLPLFDANFTNVIGFEEPNCAGDAWIAGFSSVARATAITRSAYPHYEAILWISEPYPTRERVVVASLLGGSSAGLFECGNVDTVWFDVVKARKYGDLGKMFSPPFYIAGSTPRQRAVRPTATGEID
jgi:hypothetical protein